MINWSKRKYSKEDFVKAWLSSTSIRQVAMKLQLNATGDAQKVLRRAADDLGLSNSHITGKGLNKTRNHNQHSAIPLKDILVRNSDYTNTTQLKKRIIQSKLLTDNCAICESNTWNNKPIPLQLDHINGKKTDHRIKNLRLICPNCHALTPTYRGRNRGN